MAAALKPAASTRLSIVADRGWLEDRKTDFRCLDRGAWHAFASAMERRRRGMTMAGDLHRTLSSFVRTLALALVRKIYSPVTMVVDAIATLRS